MKKHFSMVTLTLVLALAACQAITSTPTNQPSTQPVSLQQSSACCRYKTRFDNGCALHRRLPLPRLLSLPTPAVTPTPAIQIDLRRYDFDVNPPIEVLHNPPVIVRADETVNLEFGSSVGIPDSGQSAPLCTLFVSYGEGNDFTPMSLVEGYREGFDYLCRSSSQR